MPREYPRCADCEFYKVDAQIDFMNVFSSETGTVKRFAKCVKDDNYLVHLSEEAGIPRSKRGKCGPKGKLFKLRRKVKEIKNSWLWFQAWHKSDEPIGGRAIEIKDHPAYRISLKSNWFVYRFAKFCDKAIARGEAIAENKEIEKELSLYIKAKGTPES